MKKLNKNKHKKRKRKNASSSKKRLDDIILSKHPFSDIPKDILLRGLAEIGQKNIESFPETLRKVEEILSSADPLQTISTLTTFGLMGVIDHTGQVTSYKGEKFNQSHVELIQALALKTPSISLSTEFPHPDKIQELFDLTEELGETYHLRRLNELGQEKPDTEKSTSLIQEELRFHTQVVRNWGYLSKVIQITKNLCAPIPDVFVNKIGLSAGELIDIFHLLILRVEQKINSHHTKISTILRTKTIEEMLDAYQKAFPDHKDSREEMIKLAIDNNIPINAMKAMMLSYTNLALPAYYSFNIKELTFETKLNSESIQTALKKLSIKFGDLADRNSEYFFLDNPVWTKPIIQLDDEEYFCALPQAFFSFIFPILSSLLDGDPALLKEYETRRSEYLESEISELFKKAFPNCESYSGYQWIENGLVLGENDLMVRVDSHLILIEAKSHSISWPALRGAPQRAKKHVQEILLAPSVQSLKLKERMLQVLQEPEKQEALLPKLPIDLKKIKTILRLSVTLEDFATLQTTIHHTKKVGWTPEEHEIAPCILLADLEIVFDILKNTPEKIHYLKRRAELEANAYYKGDELDLLGFYLKTGFNIGEIEFDGTHLILTGMSNPIDVHYEALEEKIETKKPQLKLTPWWLDICKTLQEREIHQWSDIANILLNVSFDEQEQLLKQFKKVEKNVHKNWTIDNHICSITLIPHKHRADALAIFAFKEQNKENRYATMENISSQIFSKSHVARCLIIGINIDKKHYPYSLISVYFKPS